MATGKFGQVVLSRNHYYDHSTQKIDRDYGDDYDRRYRESRGGKKEVAKKDGYRRREKEGRKKEEIDDWCYTSSSGERSYGNGDRRQSKCRMEPEEREPGELSCGSGSDGSVASGLVESREAEAMVGLPPRKKQKVYPNVWVEEAKNAARCVHQSPEWRGVSHQEEETQEENGFSPEINVNVSRWADVEEGECNEDMSGKGKHSSDSSLTSLGSKKLSPEVDEFISRDGLESECNLQFNLIEDAEVKEEDIYDENMCYGSDTDLEEDNDYVKTPEPMSPQQRNMLHGSRSVHDFQRLNTIGAGTYGVVYQCRDKMNGEIVALKKVKMEKEREGFPMSSLREINILTSLQHPSIVEVKEVVVEEADKYENNGTFLVMEYMEHDLKGLMETMKQPFSQSEVKCLMLQLLEGVKYLHDNWVLHRDLKTSNLLLNNRGELKICDFGLSRQYGSPLKPYTPLVVTLWYRAPELLLGAKQYSTAIDMWSLGCIMAELLAKKPLFNGESEIDQLNKIFKVLGTPTETTWPGLSKLPGFKVNFVKQKYNLLREKFPPRSFIGSPYLSAAGFDLLDKLLTYDPEKRITAADAVNHEWFREIPLPKAKQFMPTFPAQHDKTRHLDDGERFYLLIYYSRRMALSFGVDLTVFLMYA